ncbi:MAG TPA: hypothetical protein PKD18_18670 [Saprospiraceae bacterium]|nr:hypothetical protein [Saprospiraceae bacterium]
MILKIPAATFLDLCQSLNKENLLKYKEHLKITKAPDGKEIRTFQNIEVENDIIIQNYANQLYEINISKNCKIHRLTLRVTTTNLTFTHNCIIGNIVLTDHANIKTLLVKNKANIGNLIISGNSNIENMSLANKCKIKNIDILNKAQISNLIFNGGTCMTFISRGEAKLDNLKFCGNSNFQELKFDDKTEIQNISIQEAFNVQGIHAIGFCKIGIFVISTSCEINVINISENAYIKILEFSATSKIREILSLSADAVVSEIIIRKNTMISILLIQDNFKFNQIEIQNNSEVGTIDINSKSMCGNFLIWDNSTTGNIAISRNSVLNNVKILDSGHTGHVEINGKLTSLEISRTISKLQLNNCVIESQLYIHNANCIEIIIKKNNETPLKILAEECNIGIFSLSNTVLFSTDIVTLNNIHISHFEMNNLINLGVFLISGLNVLNELDWVKNVKFPKINDQDKLDLPNKLVYLNQLTIKDTYLGNTQIIDCDISAFKKFHFYNSKILDIFLASCILPEESNFILEKHEDPLILNDQKRLFFGQIKSVYERQGDTPRALDALTSEMDSYKKYLSALLKKEKKSRKELIPSWKKFNLFNIYKDQVVLFLNKTTSNFGTNWIRASLITLIATAISFYIYCICLGYTIGSNWETFAELISYSPSYLNPFRDEDSGLSQMILEQKGLELTPSARFWDYISRIIIAYLIYQTVAAFRKLGKTNS